MPEGATPKDGPSAGIAMVTAIVSVMTGIPAEKDVAMTGEITLRGRVLPIGGLKEKLLAALRGGIKKVLIPEENAKDLAEIPDNVKSGLEIVPVAPHGRGADACPGAAARADRMERGGSRSPPSRRSPRTMPARRWLRTDRRPWKKEGRPSRATFFCCKWRKSGLCRDEARRALSASTEKFVPGRASQIRS